MKGPLTGLHKTDQPFYCPVINFQEKSFSICFASAEDKMNFRWINCPVVLKSDVAFSRCKVYQFIWQFKWMVDAFDAKYFDFYCTNRFHGAKVERKPSFVWKGTCPRNAKLSQILYDAELQATTKANHLGSLLFWNDCKEHFLFTVAFDAIKMTVSPFTAHFVLNIQFNLKVNKKRFD